MPKLQDEIKQSVPFEDPRAEAMLNIAYTHERLSRRHVALLKQHKLTNVMYNALRILRGAGPCALKSLDILDRLIWGTPDITRLIDNLEKVGLAERHRCDEDRRVIYVQITDKGKKLLRKLDKPMKNLVEELLGHIGKKDLNLISKLMQKIRDGLPEE